MTFDKELQGYASRQVYQGRHVQFLVLDQHLAARRTLDVPYIAISITQAHDSYPDTVLASSPLRRGVLRLRFDDVDDVDEAIDSCQPFTDQHARQIIQFVVAHRHEIRGILLNCAAGISRSAAVASSLSEWLNGEEADFFDRYFAPNPRVRHILSRTIKIIDPDGPAGENDESNT